ncbi:hypothetical protein PFICI_09656 [Pestalotiopsis fici W106-1]|uniref:DNA 3'-5' helicase n=1 Tax=Pestalotiopsis fici (strain W106-1 / CGMCC3.15140) TaxID=1229662 RepID=W3WUV5_PESFW|nr:uncharacterized protein PFICI_09656 [Pestalotiopsis fici W106-1]ETS77594.1 hypothetical protein PFICI_09656 [Pestalotiopsis fici W106-1]
MSGHTSGSGSSHNYDCYIQDIIKYASDFAPGPNISQSSSYASGANETTTNDVPLGDPFTHVPEGDDHLDDFDRQLLGASSSYDSNQAAHKLPLASSSIQQPIVLNDASHHFRQYATRGDRAQLSQFTAGHANLNQLDHIPVALSTLESDGSIRMSGLSGRSQFVAPPLYSGQLPIPDMMDLKILTVQAKPHQISPKHLSSDTSSPSLGISSPSVRPSIKRTALETVNRPSTSQVPASITGGTSMDLQHASENLTSSRYDQRTVLLAKYRDVFPYAFNYVQSKCFPYVYGSDDNVVVSAPTSSGKTAILEMAICNLLNRPNGETFKIVYQAPTKSLCSERARDWRKKFSHLNLQCVELTGDTSPSEVRKVGGASIIVTTPEKWDSITRKWSDHHRLLDMVRLVLIDEVHIVKDIRGATLEAVVSRMKTSGANVRFIALSATIPNLNDIAVWLGRNHRRQEQPARQFGFGEELRPVKLQKYVHGYKSSGNDFAFDKVLDGKLISLLSQYGERKPILVFCFTRKSCEQTAIELTRWWASLKDIDKPWPGPKNRVAVSNKDLEQIVTHGVAFHHGGLDAVDRKSVESSYLNGDLHVICCTSTLAVGVNLPCHTVVLKGTVGYVDGIRQEYSDLEVMQMLGRAGRPQFDPHGTAIIITRLGNVPRYEKMISGQEALESKLHLNLIEHLNSEIGLGTIKNVHTAKKWLAGTFLFVRMKQAPKHYLSGMPELDIRSPSDSEDLIQAWCERDIEQLQVHRLITSAEPLSCTQYGAAMSRFMVSFETMKQLLEIPMAVDAKHLLICLSKTTTFEDLRLKSQDKGILPKLNSAVMYPVSGSPRETWHKVYLFVQFSLAAFDMPADESGAIKKQILTEKNVIFERINRLVRCVIDCKVHDGDGLSVKAGLELTRALAANCWDTQSTQLLQIPGLGPVTMRRLTSHGIKTVSDLATRSFVDIERFVGRNPPYGKKLLQTLEAFPRLRMTSSVLTQNHGKFSESEDALMITVKVNLGYENQNVPRWNGRAPIFNFMAHAADGRLTYFTRANLNHVAKSGNIELRFPVAVRSVDETITCCFSCEEIVGTMVTEVISPNLSPLAFQVLSRRRSSPTSNNEPLEEIVDGMDEEGIADADMLDAFAASEADVNKGPGKQPRLAKQDDVKNMEFQDIDDLLEDIPVSEKLDGTAASPILMSNGKWRCQHRCAGGALTKNGKPCTHKCCHEGAVHRPKLLIEHKKSTKVKEDQAKSTSNTERNASMALNKTIQHKKSTKVKEDQAKSTSNTERDASKALNKTAKFRHSKYTAMLDVGPERSSLGPSNSKRSYFFINPNMKRPREEPSTIANESRLGIHSKKPRDGAEDDNIESLDLRGSSNDELEAQSARQSHQASPNQANKRLSVIHNPIQPLTIVPPRLIKTGKALATPKDVQVMTRESSDKSDVFGDESEKFSPPEILQSVEDDPQEFSSMRKGLFQDETLAPDIRELLEDRGRDLSFAANELQKTSRSVKPKALEDVILKPGKEAAKHSQNVDQNMRDKPGETFSNTNVPYDMMNIDDFTDKLPSLEDGMREDDDKEQELVASSSDKRATPLPGEPAWVGEYDQNLIDELRSSVEFIE